MGCQWHEQKQHHALPLLVLFGSGRQRRITRCDAKDHAREDEQHLRKLSDQLRHDEQQEQAIAASCIHILVATGEDPTSDDGTGGHLEVVQWLHANRNEGCTTQAMDGATRHGHCDVVQFLHEQRSEGCTVLAIDDASENGHFDVVKFLHNHRTEGCCFCTRITAKGVQPTRFGSATLDVAQITRRDYYMTAVLDHILWQTFVDEDCDILKQRL